MMTSWDIKLKGRIKKYIEISNNVTDHCKKIELPKSFLTPRFLLLRGDYEASKGLLSGNRKEADRFGQLERR